MKTPHSQAKLLRDIARHVESVNPGSEPFASGLKTVHDAAWEMLILREIEWAAIGGKTQYVFSSNGRPPVVPPKTREFGTYERTVMKTAQKALTQYRRHCEWIDRQYCKALDAELNGRMRLRVLTSRSKFDGLVKRHFDEVRAWMAGAEGAEIGSQAKRMADRTGGVFYYRDHMYGSRAEVERAQREDTPAVASDHDLIVMMCEEAFPPRENGIDREKWDELARYLKSKDHRDVLSGKATDPEAASRYEKMLNQIINAQRKLAGLTDPLPKGLHKHLGIGHTWWYEIMSGRDRTTRESIMEALQDKLYELSPQRKPRGKRRKAEVAADEVKPQTMPPSMADNHPAGCQCVRHKAL
jgi:hypothetical protein